MAKKDDWTPKNPKWWTDQHPLTAVEAAKGYFLLKLLKYGVPLGLVAWLLWEVLS